MAAVEKGALLTCGHEGCNCQVHIEEVCTCPGAGDHYTCICGSPLAEKSGSAVGQGPVLTCGHEGCDCQVRIEAACDCPGAGDHYTCVCGSPLVEKAA